MLSLPDTSPFSEKLHEKRKSDCPQTSPTLDLEFYKYNLPLSYRNCNRNFFETVDLSNFQAVHPKYQSR